MSYYDKKRQERTTTPIISLGAVFMPDNGIQADPKRMEELGYTCHIDTQHPERDAPTRWWFNTEKNRDKIQPGIEARGFEVIN